MKFIQNLTCIASVTVLSSLAITASAEDKYLKSLEDRIAALEAEVNATQTDAKGKGGVESMKIPVYVTPKSKYVEELKLGGLIQWQNGYSWGHGYQSPGSGTYSTSEIRRLRVNLTGKVADDFAFLVEFEVIGATSAQFGLVNAYISYTGCPYVIPKVGKYKPRFGYEEYTSSSKLYTVERTRMSNAFATQELTGASVEGEISFFNYFAGIFNAVPGGSGSTQDTNPFTNVAGKNNQDYVYNASVGLNFTELLSFPLEFRADYMNFVTNPLAVLNGGATDQPNRVNLHQNIDVSMHTCYGPAELNVEWYYGFDSNAASANLVKSGSGDEYAWAIMVEPMVYIIPDRLQYVFRYEYGNAGFTTVGINQPYATRVRYERFLPGAGAGALNYFAIYNGLNYFVHGHDLKLMLGHYYSEQQGAIGGGKGNDRVAQSLYGQVQMMF